MVFLFLLLISFQILYDLIINPSFCFRVCKWLLDELKEEYLQNARVIEKAVLKAVSLPSFYTALAALLVLIFPSYVNLPCE